MFYNSDNIFQKTLQGQKTKKIPIWIMRQAGRYLPEYMNIRKNVSNFLEMCTNSELASEVTLQPIRRYNLDSAIIFSDILIIPYALGQKVEFVKNEGPKLEKIESKKDLEKLNIENIDKILSHTYQAIEKVRSSLDSDKSLIGFAGSPWTVATYMIEGGGSKEFMDAKIKAFKEESFFDELIQILIEATSTYLINQVKAGADVLKLFDSWSGVLPEYFFEKYVIEPNKAIIKNVRKIYPDVKFICFPKGAGLMYEKFAKAVKPDVLALDSTVPLDFATDVLQNYAILQGNLDPFILLAGKDKIKREATKILDKLSGNPFIFNLGHGISKETNPEDLKFLIDIIRSYR